MSSSDVSPCPTPVGTPISTQAPKYGTVIPNRIFVGGITTTSPSQTTEAELKAFFTSYGTVKDTKIIADRGGVSKGYGFVTFENQEDADRILKKEAENLIFKDRKLNIGPAIRKQVHMTTQLLADLYAQGAAEQVSPRSYGDPNLHPGTVLLSTNGVPYTYQNGMAIFHASESGYPIAQPQPAYSAAAVMVSQPPPPVYMAPTYPTYQPGTPPQWTTPTPSQWRWTAQGTMAAVAKETLPCSSGGGGNIHHMYVTDLPSTSEQQPQRPLPTLPPVTATANPLYSVHTTSQLKTQLPPPPTIPLSIKATTYRKPLATAPPRRSYSSPTLLVKHGHKVQRLMAKTSTGPIRTILQKSDSDVTVEGALSHSHLTSSSPVMNKSKASQIVSAYEAF
ncbi:protein boule-like isoform X5 [Octopus bimaculoides]|uniref:RRM domain-containing protein n=1 Tax=Octopus bimaculoides TaxID=37653 RepID=A0A0L8G2E0_OCTBM|nr:protein boule-like isoform X5 [Octopus bimaculoides]|eukprot:XP_014784800.1 PREDICTED: protein boule-like isoform X4 [Octopus bimaculoides]